MRILACLMLLLLPFSLSADPLECLPDGSIEQIVENLPPGSKLYRDCYHCEKPAYELIVIHKAEVRPCHLPDSATDRAIYITGTIQSRFAMQKCGVITDRQNVKVPLANELVVLNYSWLTEPKTGEATNVADMFGENSNHVCKRFMDRPSKDKSKQKKKDRK